jgi:hypothetical protein
VAQPTTHTACMGRFLPLIIVALLMIYCVVEVAQAPTYAVRRMPRWLWATAIICLPLVGAACWLLLGRPNAESLGKRPSKMRYSAPDDDVDFLRGL